MENLRNDYPYLPLNVAEDEIRLLEILPRGSDPSTPVQACLIHRSLKQSPRYDALSYIWGHASQQATIRLDDRDFTVTSNLERALRDVTYFSNRQNEVLVIWADAVCINQRDFEERNAQVKMMWRIYAGAETVRSWIDVEIPDPVLEKLMNITSVESLGEDPNFWEPIATIVEDPYWSRVWVQQEVAYAKDQVIQCRNMPLPHAGFVWFFEVLDMYLDKYQPVMEPIEAAKWRGLRVGSSPFEKNKSSSVESPRCYKKIYDALNKTTHLKSTDTRDRVYGLLALIQDDIDDIQVNYELPASEIYCQVAQLLIEKYHSLIFLNLGALNICEEHTGVPTWFPYPRRHPTGIFGSSTDLGTSEFSWHQSLLSPITHSSAILPHISTDHQTLHVHGMCISKIRGVCRHMSWQGIHAMGDFLNVWDQVFEKWVAIRSENHSSVTKSDATRSFIRTMFICRTSEAATKSVSDNLTRFEEFFPIALAEQQKETPDLANSMRQFDYVMWGILSRTMATCSLNRYLVLTQEGTMGLAPLATELGDEVWMLFRHPIPMVLRREDDHYFVVGPAFVDFEEQEMWDKAMAGYEEGHRKCGGSEVRCIALR